MRASDAPANDENSDYDHMERLHYVDTEVTQDETTLLSNVLATALPGLERLLGDDRHDILKGKVRYNSIGISFNGGRDDKVRRHSWMAFESLFELHFAACAGRPSRGHRKDAYALRHFETNRNSLLLRFQLRKSHVLG